jgi:hypothetical protein
LFFACGDSADNKTKSLDNFAAGERLISNKCQGDPALADNKAELKTIEYVLTNRVKWKTNANKQKLAKALAMSFRAIPIDMQQMFLRLGGTFMVTSESNKLCSSMYDVAAGRESLKKAELNAMSEAQGKVQACYYFMPPAIWQTLEPEVSEKQQLFTIILKDNPSEIHHNLVRSFGYIASQVSSHISTNDPTFRSGNLNVRWTNDENMQFRTYKGRVFQAFLADLESRNSLGHFKKYKEKKVSEVQMRNMEDFTYAEAFDSFFCNQHAPGKYNTLKTFESSFKQTLKAFLKAPTGTIAGASLHAQTELPVARSGFSLTTQINPIAIFNGAKSVWNAGVETYEGAGILANEYGDRRNQRIETMTQQVTQYNGGQPPSALQTVSIAANSAYRDPSVTSNAIVGGVTGASIDFADSMSGATIGTNGQPSVLTPSQNSATARRGLANTALEVAPIGDAVSAVGRTGARMVGRGANMFTDATVEALGQQGRQVDLNAAARITQVSDGVNRFADNAGRQMNNFGESVNQFKQNGIINREGADFLGSQAGQFTPQGLATSQVKQSVTQAVQDTGTGQAGTFTPAPQQNTQPAPAPMQNTGPSIGATPGSAPAPTAAPSAGPAM